MEGHAAFPDREDRERVLDVAGEVVEEDVAEPATEHDAGGRPNEEIVEILRLQRRGAGCPKAWRREKALPVLPGEENADDIADAVPVDRERSDPHEHRIDLREGQDRERHEKCFGQDRSGVDSAAGPWARGAARSSRASMRGTCGKRALAKAAFAP